MDNVTHSLLGAALATFALPTAVLPRQRTLFLAAGILASNAPDLDLLYVGIMPPPLGYLLHHRGHTHTLAGLAGLGALFGLAALAIPALRRLIRGNGARLSLLIAVALVSHVLLDACNSYGVHALYPIDAGWYYGDSLFIIEPWLWLLLAAALPWHALSRLAGGTLLALIALLGVSLAIAGIVPILSIAAMAATGAAIAWGARGMARQTRAGAALMASVLFVAGMFGLSRAARAEAYTAMAPRVRGAIVDIVLSPNPAAPLCWAVIGVEHDPRTGELALHRGTLSLLPAWQSPERCTTHRLLNRPIAIDRADDAGRATSSGTNGGTNGSGSEESIGGDGRTRGDVQTGGDDREGRTPVSRGNDIGRGNDRIAWSDEIREPLQALRDLRQRDCRVRAWLQFGRAPFIRHGALVDLRFENGTRGNFSALPLGPAGDIVRCPPYITPWATPRADLLDTP